MFIHQTRVKNLGEFVIADPQYGDLKLNVMPFQNTGEWIKLPVGFELWEESFNAIVGMIPLHEGANQHYVTIDSKFFTRAESLRREGVHADGNFCVDPNFTGATWGGVTTTWGGSKYHPELIVEKDWDMPYDIDFPVGDYISGEKGGIICVSSEVGCQAWAGEFIGRIGSEGCFDEMLDQLTDDRKTVFEKNQLYFMTSNTPHESLVIEKGVRRTFMRITLNHEFPNNLLIGEPEYLMA